MPKAPTTAFTQQDVLRQAIKAIHLNQNACLKTFTDKQNTDLISLAFFLCTWYESPLIKCILLYIAEGPGTLMAELEGTFSNEWELVGVFSILYCDIDVHVHQCQNWRTLEKGLYKKCLPPWKLSDKKCVGLIFLPRPTPRPRPRRLGDWDLCDNEAVGRGSPRHHHARAGRKKVWA